jgi:hypothetical protein
MQLKLISHINSDGDILEAWLRHYLRLGVSSFHLIVHGSQADNARLFVLRNSFPITIEDSYDGEFSAVEKKRRLNLLLASMTGQWVVLADSDEFVEFPYRRIPMTIRMLEWARANMLFAPMLQHLTVDGSLDSPEIIEDPFRTFPLCSVALYQKMGTKASIDKFPLFYCVTGTALVEGGNHHPPLGGPPVLSKLRGVTHHFKFRRSVFTRLDNRIQSSHLYRHESIQFRRYLEDNGNILPTEDAFMYSRGALLRRDLLRRYTLRDGLRFGCRIITGNRSL